MYWTSESVTKIYYLVNDISTLRRQKNNYLPRKQ